MNIFHIFDQTPGEWVLIFVCGFFIGLSKTGIKGMGIIAIAILAVLFGGKLSTGIVLPMLIMADIFAVAYFRRHAEWKYLVHLLPWSFVGIGLGTYFGNQIDDATFKLVMGLIIVISLGLLVWQDYRRIGAIPHFWWFSMIMGLLAGFTTMVGNLAGPITVLYFLSMRLPKNAFIGTGAWFFLVANIFKIPFHIFSWGTITLTTFTLNLWLFPAIAVGAVLGFILVAYFSNEVYRKFVIGITLISAVLLLM